MITYLYACVRIHACTQCLQTTCACTPAQATQKCTCLRHTYSFIDLHKTLADVYASRSVCLQMLPDKTVKL